MADNIVFGSGGEFESIQRLTCVTIDSSRTPTGSDLDCTENADQRVTGEGRLKKSGQFAVSVWQMFVAIALVLLRLVFIGSQSTNDCTQSKQTLVDMGTLSPPFFVISRLFRTSQID